MSAARRAPGLIVAAPASGSGKTVATLGLLRALRDAGVRVASAKVGPDYIDPQFHMAASGRACFNLDAWAMRPMLLDNLMTWLGDETDLILAEGVMGLFDGIDAAGTGSTADLAALTGWPVVLVVDARAQSASAAALVAGFVRHRAGVTVAGVILNRVAGETHDRVLREAIARTTPETRVLGAIPRDAALALPERHLGLVQAIENDELDGAVAAIAAVVERHVDLAALRALARPTAFEVVAPWSPPVPPLGQRIAFAYDEAFAFSYLVVVDSWRMAGAGIAAFSPLADEAPAADADAVYLPGGYPELHGGRLAGNSRFLEGLRAAAARGAAIYGECGGYMVLGAGLVDAAGERHAMAGLLPLETSFAQRRLRLGYRQAVLAADGPLGAVGSGFRGHEFHYATVLDEGEGAPLFAVMDAGGRHLGMAGRRRGSVMGSFVHLIDRVA